MADWEQNYRDMTSDPEWGKFPMPVRNELALDFFHKKVAPTVTSGDMDSARHDFMSMTFPAPEQPKNYAPDFIVNAANAVNPGAAAWLQEGVPKQFMGGLGEAGTLGYAKPFEEELKTPEQAIARGAGDLVGQAAIFELGGAGLKTAGLAAEGLLPTILRQGIVGSGVGAGQAEAESHGKASWGDVGKQALQSGLMAAGLGAATELGAPSFRSVFGGKEAPGEGATISGEAPKSKTIEVTSPEVKAKGPPDEASKFVSRLDKEGINPAKSEQFGNIIPEEIVNKSGKIGLQDWAQKAFEEGHIKEPDEQQLVDWYKSKKESAPGFKPLDVEKDLPDDARRWIGQIRAMPADEEGKSSAIADFIKHGKFKETVSMAEAESIASKLGMTPEQFMEQAKTKMFTSPEWLGAMRTASGLVDDAAAAAVKLKDAVTPEQNAAANYEYAAVKARRDAFLDMAKGDLSDAARKMNFAGQLKKALRTGGDDFLDAARKTLGKDWFDPKEAEYIKYLHEKDPAAANAYIASRMNSSFADKTLGYFRGNILLQSVTPLKVMLDNFTNLITDVPAKGGAAVINWARNLGGDSQTRFVKAETLSRLYGNSAGISKGFSAAWDTLSNGVNVKDVEDFRFRPNPGKFAVIQNWANRLVTSAHLLPRIMVEEGQRHAGAMNAALQDLNMGKIKNEQVNGAYANYLENPTPEMAKATKEAGLRAAYQTKPGAIGKAIKTAVNYEMVGGWKPLKFLLPFENITVNRPSQVLEWTPLGLTKLLGKDLKPEMREDIGSRMILGSALAYMLGQKMLNSDVAWGKGPITKSKAEYDQWLMQHKGVQYGFRVGDSIYGFNHFGTLSQAVGSLATAIDQHKYNKQNPSPGDAYKIAYAFANALTDSSVIKNISDVMNVVRAKPQGTRTGGMAEAIAAPIMQGMVPASGALKEAAHLADRDQTGMIVRDTHGEIAKRVKADLPGLGGKGQEFDAQGRITKNDGGVVPKLDVLGRVVHRSGGVAQPIMHSDVQDKYSDYLTKSNLILPSTPQKVHGVDLSDENYYNYRVERGTIVRNILDNVMKSNPGNLNKIQTMARNGEINKAISEVTSAISLKYALHQDPKGAAVGANKLLQLILKEQGQQNE